MTMTNVALISRWINQCRGVRETQILAALLAGIATALIAGCQKPEHELCTSTGEPSELWSKYDLPKVEGAELCSEYEAENGHGVTFIHHHDREHSYIDYSDPYEEGFTERGWRTAKVTSSKSDWGMYLARAGDTLYVSFQDCSAGRDVSLHGSCTSVSIRETNGVPPLK